MYPDDVASAGGVEPELRRRAHRAPNLVVVRVPANGIVDFYHYANFGGSTFLLADVVGFFDGDKSTEAGRLFTGVPARVTDTAPRARHRRQAASQLGRPTP